MKRRFYPASFFDRLGFWLILFAAATAALLFGAGAYMAAVYIIAAILVEAILIYVYQDEPKTSRSGEKADVARSIQEVERIVASLASYVEREEKRVAEANSDLERLRDERDSLEPLVKDYRKGADDIRKAFSGRPLAGVWKERVLVFVLGFLASLAAAAIWEYIKPS